MPHEFLDLTEMLPDELTVKTRTREVTVSTDIFPVLASRAFAWLNEWGTDDANEEWKVRAWEIGGLLTGIPAEEVEGELGLLGVSRLIRFFSEYHMRKMGTTPSSTPSELPEPLTEELPSETSSEVAAS